jgi:mitochondrial import receptor subunit TOM70
MAAALKAKGNNAYQLRKFTQAAELYTQAIEISPKPEPVFYSNRAACEFSKFHANRQKLIPASGYVNMSPPKHELVIENCDAALKLDRNYVKALNRRAGALEGLKRYEEALRGMSDDQNIIAV